MKTKTLTDQQRSAQLASLRGAVARVEAEALLADVIATRAAKRLATGSRTERPVLQARADDAHREARAIHETLATLRERVRDLEATKPKRLTLGDVHLRMSEPAFLADLVDGSALARGLAARLLRDDPAARALAHGDVDRLTEHLRNSAMAHLHNVKRLRATTRR